MFLIFPFFFFWFADFANTSHKPIRMNNKNFTTVRQIDEFRELHTTVIPNVVGCATNVLLKLNPDDVYHYAYD